MRYEIDSEGVHIFDDNGVRFVFQDVHPDNRNWAGTKEMEDWAKDFIANWGKPVTPAVIIPDKKTIVDLGE